MREFHSAIQPINNNVIYIYKHIDVASHVGFLKIGQKRGLDSSREIQQNEADNVQIEKLYQAKAVDINGNVFTDHELHRELEKRGYEREKKQNTKTGRMSEWFKISLEDAQQVLEDRIQCRNNFEVLRNQQTEFALRPNQQQAVDQTYDWWLNERDRKYLWNAKPRFGKTLTAYEFAKRIEARRILVVTQRTAISDSWFKDFHDWIKGRTDYVFGSAKNNVNKTPEGNTIGRALTTDETKTALKSNQDVIYYISLADIKGQDETRAEFKQKNKWLFDTQWDLFIIDEAHEGIETDRFQSVFDSLQSNFTLHLSGTPFKALANNQFGQNIYNWTYADEQEQKEGWDVDQGENPYADMPTMNIFAYQMSNELKQVAATNDFSFDFSEFFKISGGKFTHEDEILSFLDKLVNAKDRPDDDRTIQYYPFADRDTRDILRHTFWLLPMSGGVKIANTLKVLLQNHPIFKEYEIISAVGTGDIERQNDSALKEVIRRIGSQPWHTKTITLSCGQLTTGVTVAPWTGVLMLNNLKSPAQYLQAAFRSQNPWKYKIEGETFNKTDCYVFDFAPDRVLKIVSQYAGKLDTSGASREQKIKKLLNFLPVISRDETGQMKALDATEVMNLPLRLDVADVVNNGFMDNKLFSIGNIFNLTKDQREAANEILGELKAVKNKKQSHDTSEVHTQDIDYDNEGNLIINQETIINSTEGLLKDRKYAIEGSEEAQAIEDAISRGEDPKSEIVTRDELEKVVREKIVDDATKMKRDEQQEQRDHLRGFSRTIPMFLMAYGKSDTTLANFDRFVSAGVFAELAGISIDAFRFLRDECKLFNEEVFNASITEFLKRKQLLARYYLNDSGEDIFEYIPPQSKDNNQIFTPKNIVIAMVDMMEHHDPSLFRRNDSTFIDPYMKSGLFIAEIVKRLYSHSKIKDEGERIKHILTHQVFGFAPTPILLKICQQTIASFDYKLWGNFVHKALDNAIMKAEGTIEDAIRKEWGFNMKFDVVIGNPPYQLSDGGHSTSAMPIYQKFVEQAIKLNPKYLSMIMPARWYSGGKGLDDFRDQMLHDTRIRQIVDYPEAIDAFQGVQIKGGVMYFLWDRDNRGAVTVSTFRKDRIVSTMERTLLEKGATTFIRYNEAIRILEKVQALQESSLSKQISSRKPFGLDTLFKGQTKSGADSITLYQIGDTGFVNRNAITKNVHLLDKYKVLIPYLGSGSDSFPHSILGRPFIADPNSASTETYLVAGSFDDRKQAENLLSYISTRFLRFLVLLSKNSQHATAKVYQFVPNQDFTQEWTDEKLYKKYGLSSEEISFINSMIRPMDLKKS